MQVVNLAIAEHGAMETWDWQDSYTGEEKDAFVKKYFLPYMNVVKFCPADGSVLGCFPDVTYTYLNGNARANYEKTALTPRVLLADGSSIRFYFASNCVKNATQCASFDIDINGHKKPNVAGLDFQVLVFYPKTGEFLPNGINAGVYSSETGAYEKRTLEEINNSCNRSSNGQYCAAKIVQEGFKINY